MTIKERYNQLTDKELTLEDFHDILQLKNDCKLEMNKEYFYLCDILIIDSYIQGNLLDDALKIAINSIENIDSNVFSKIYALFLERIIYICIQKKNFKSAYRYAFNKRNFIDLENIDQVNRWYLEMAYIYAELNETEKALMNLKAILANYPDDYLKSLALSNMTKIYIDQKLISEAKETLSQCMSLVLTLNDSEGLLYCDYLNAKIYVLENNYNNAKTIFEDIFNAIEILEPQYLGIGNEYLSLLVEMEDLDTSFEFINRYHEYFENTEDLYNKKDYYKNYLKILILKNNYIKDELLVLLKSIDQIEKDIIVADKSLFDEISEEDKFLEVNNRLKETISKIENTINVINLALLNDTERNNLMDFFQKLEKIINFNRAIYVIFNKANFDILPDFIENFNMVSTYEYKKERLYERQLPYSTLTNTILEPLLISNNEMIVDFTDTNLNLNDIISGKTYLEQGTKSLIAVPLIYEKEMFAAAIFTSNTTNLVNSESILIIKIACKLLEFKLISLFYQDSLNSQKNILQIAINGLQEGMFYLEPKKQRMILTDQLSDFLGVHTKNYSKDEYIKLIHPDDLNKYKNIYNSIDIGESYSIKYRLITDTKEFVVNEQASPYINKDGIIKFYVGTINKINTIEKVREKSFNLQLLNETDFNLLIEEVIEKSLDLDYKFSLIKFKIENLSNFNRKIFLKDYIIEYVYQLLIYEISDNIYFLDDESFICYIENSDQRSIEKIIRDIISKLDKGVSYKDQIININTYASYVRYPRDSHNIKELNNFTSLAITFDNKIQPFTEDMNKNYIKSMSVSKCISEELNKQLLELLLIQLYSDEKIKRFEVKFNVPGLTLKDNAQEYLSGQLLINFEKKILSRLLESINEIDNTLFYINLCTDTLSYLLNSNYFKNNDLNKYKKLVICIRNNDLNMSNIIEQLINFGFNISINIKCIKKVELDKLIKLSIKGVYISESIDNYERNILLKIFDILHYEILTDYQFPDYYNVISRSDKLLTLDDIKNN